MMSAPSLTQRLKSLKNQLAEAASKVGSEVTLVAVSKTKPDADLMEAYHSGHRDFGENRVQELVGKASRLPSDIRWHMIGHIQTNKIKDFLPFVHLVHGVDRLKVLQVLQKEAAKIERQIDILLQVHIAKESTKFGFAPEELHHLADSKKWEDYPNLRPLGLMGMATLTDDQDQIRREFESLSSLHTQVGLELGKVAKARGSFWGTLSMGMSGDWPVAVEKGSTMVRVGSSIFGHRDRPAS